MDLNAPNQGFCYNRTKHQSSNIFLENNTTEPDSNNLPSFSNFEQKKYSKIQSSTTLTTKEYNFWTLFQKIISMKHEHDMGHDALRKQSHLHDTPNKVRWKL